MTSPARANTWRGLRLELVSARAWLALAAVSYFELPLEGFLSLVVWLVILAGWGYAVVTTFVAVISALRRRVYVRAAAWLAAAATAATLIWTTDWPTLYANSQFHLHRGELAALAGHFNSAYDDDVNLPLDMRYLSIDGHAHRRDAALYIPVWQNFRAEQGIGIAYFPGDTATGAIIATADGDISTPTRYLGDGWWVIVSRPVEDCG